MIFWLPGEFSLTCPDDSPFASFFSVVSLKSFVDSSPRHTLSTRLGKHRGTQFLACVLYCIYCVRICQTVFQHVFIIPLCIFHFRLGILDIICGRMQVLFNV
ncbi:hypothetical protein H671_3g11096 [Cricetulus griseus]|nr:hypothetical protein H671_3g11096 [Cricetulus griseus]